MFSVLIFLVLLLADILIIFEAIFIPVTISEKPQYIVDGNTCTDKILELWVLKIVDTLKYFGVTAVTKDGERVVEIKKSCRAKDKCDHS